MNEQEQPRRRRRRLCRTSADWFGLAAMVLLMICSLVLLVQLMSTKLLTDLYLILIEIVLLLINAGHVIIQLPIRRVKTSKVVCGLLAVILSGLMLYGSVAAASGKSALLAIAGKNLQKTTSYVVVMADDPARSIGDTVGYTFGILSQDADISADNTSALLEDIKDGLGGKVNGVPREDHFMITVASEVMAILCLAADLDDLKKRFGDILVAYSYTGKPIYARDLHAEGAMTALMKDAIKPNLVQTLEGTPCLMHGGPFANIAHGCNSVQATKLALKLGDIAITEAGFGADLGAEKFLDIKCRMAGLKPSAVVLVTSTKALKWHGGVPLPEIGKPDVEALRKGLCNLDAHVRNLKNFGPEIVVSLNHFHTDTDEEIEIIRNRCTELGVRFAVCDGFARGGDGAVELARAVLEAADEPRELHFAYEEDAPLLDKVTAVVRKVYGGEGIELSEAAKKDLKRIVELGFGHLPVCIAKTPFSLTADGKALGAPTGFTVPVQRFILNAGAGFVVVTTGAVMRMPGLPKAPAAMQIDVVDGKITGLA